MTASAIQHVSPMLWLGSLLNYLSPQRSLCLPIIPSVSPSFPLPPHNSLCLPIIPSVLVLIYYHNPSFIVTPHRTLIWFPIKKELWVMGSWEWGKWAYCLFTTDDSFSSCNPPICSDRSCQDRCDMFTIRMICQTRAVLLLLSLLMSISDCFHKSLSFVIT